MNSRMIISLLAFSLVLIGCGKTGKSSRVKYDKTPYQGPLITSPAEKLPPGIKPKPKIVRGLIGAPDNPIPRAKWSGGDPNLSNINPMQPIHRITIHHDGLPGLFVSSSMNDTAGRIELIRHRHRNGNGWADIGYHYVIDREGRLWQARDTKYQGAHVKDQNEGNLGILVLGNFQLQQPKPKQILALKKTIQFFRSKYKVPVNRVYTHGELGATSCPGAALQRYVNAIRAEASGQSNTATAE